MPEQPQDLDVVEHPTLGPLKFPKDMPPDERNASIQRVLISRPDAQAPPSVPSPKLDMTRVGGPGILDSLRNGRPKPPHYDMPGSFEGHPENIGEYVPQTIGQAASGVKDVAHGDVSRGLHKGIGAVGSAMLPVAPFIATAAPWATAKAITGGLVGGGLASGATSALGGSEDQADLAGDVGNIVGGGVGVKAPTMMRSAARAIIPRIANVARSAPVDLVGAFSPRAAHIRNLAIKADDLLSSLPAQRAIDVPQLEAPASPAASHLKDVIANQKTLQAQPPFPRQWEGLPEVEEGQSAATEHLHKAIQPNDMRATSPPINTSKARVGSLLEQATGGKPLAKGIPIGQQFDRVTPKESSVVKSHSYDPSAKEMTVTTNNGQTYVHGDVTPDQAAAFSDADSKGKAWNELRNNSTLVAKVQGGKRIAIKPTSSRCSY
jgi:hypothetical protein